MPALQAALAWVVSSLVLSAVLNSNLWRWLDSLGGLFGAVADWQLARFKSDPAHNGKVMDAGLMRYSRHPNYFGECCVCGGAFTWWRCRPKAGGGPSLRLSWRRYCCSKCQVWRYKKKTSPSDISTNATISPAQMLSSRVGDGRQASDSYSGSWTFALELIQRPDCRLQIADCRLQIVQLSLCLVIASEHQGSRTLSSAKLRKDEQLEDLTRKREITAAGLEKDLAASAVSR